jgi:predicted nucleic acid-binding protein
LRVNTLQTIFTAPNVISELTDGALRRGNPTAALANAYTIQHKYPTLDIDADLGNLAGQIELNLRAAGQLIPEEDIRMAAAAIGHQLALVTREQHFKRIAGLTVEQG